MSIETSQTTQKASVIDDSPLGDGQVIDNVYIEKREIIDNDKSQNRRAFDRYKANVKAVHELRVKAGALKAAWPWWHALDEDVKAFVLSSVAKQDDWKRWAGCEWGSMPQTLRDAIAVKARRMCRQLGACPWQ